LLTVIFFHSKPHEHSNIKNILSDNHLYILVTFCVFYAIDTLLREENLIKKTTNSQTFYKFQTMHKNTSDILPWIRQDTPGKSI